MLLEPKDFPQMWQKPSSDDILDTLKQLELSPPIWSHNRRRSDIIHEQEATAYFRREVSLYLSSIIKSGLSWIKNDDEKEEIWSEASRRMAERCGRTAMGEITRRWPFREDALTPTFELIIREPPLTGDSLGLKTWASSYVLAQSLPSIGSTALFRLFDESLGQPRPSVLELGSGTGLLGLAAAALWKAHVVLMTCQILCRIYGTILKPTGLPWRSSGGHWTREPSPGVARVQTKLTQTYLTRRTSSRSSSPLILSTMTVTQAS